MNALFNVDQYNQPVVKYVSDPYWDELEKLNDDFVDDNNPEFLDDSVTVVLDSQGMVEESGQLTLFYDDSTEPPDPDDFTTAQDYETAFLDWRKKHPDDSITFMSDDSVTKEDYPEKSKPKNDSLTFEVDGVYWHPKKQLKVKILKIYHSVKKADVYFERDFEVYRILLSEITQLPEVSESEVTTAQSDSLTSINIYKAAGKARGNNQYFRYSYKLGKRTKHIHIPGGNVSSPLVQERVEQLKVAIAKKLPPVEIEKIIKQFKSA